MISSPVKMISIKCDQYGVISNYTNAQRIVRQTYIKNRNFYMKRLSGFQTCQICQKIAKIMWITAKYWLNRFLLHITNITCMDHST